MIWMAYTITVNLASIHSEAPSRRTWHGRSWLGHGPGWQIPPYPDLRGIAASGSVSCLVVVATGPTVTRLVYSEILFKEIYPADAMDLCAWESSEKETFILEKKHQHQAFTFDMISGWCKFRVALFLPTWITFCKQVTKDKNTVHTQAEVNAEENDEKVKQVLFVGPLVSKGALI